MSDSLQHRTLQQLQAILKKESALWEGMLRIKKRMHRHQRVANIALFHVGRCGSTVLTSLIRQHPEVFWAAELFTEMSKHQSAGDWQQDDYFKMLELTMYAESTSYFGFQTKFLPEHNLGADCLNMTVAELVDRLVDLRFNAFVVLKRANYLRRAVSAIAGRETGIWSVTAKPHVATKVHIDVEEFQIGGQRKSLLSHFQELDDNYTQLEAALQGRRCLWLCYEQDIMADPHIAYQRFCEFIEIPAVPVETKLARANPFPLAQSVENLTDVERALRDTRYEWMLAD